VLGQVAGGGENTSVPRLVGNLLKEMIQEEADYALAMEQYLMIQPMVLKQAGGRYPRLEACATKIGRPSGSPLRGMARERADTQVRPVEASHYNGLIVGEHLTPTPHPPRWG